MKAEDYLSFVDAWEGRATIRTRLRRIAPKRRKTRSTRSAVSQWC